MPCLGALLPLSLTARRLARLIGLLAPLSLAALSPGCSSSDEPSGEAGASGSGGSAGAGGSPGKKVDPLPLAQGCQPLLAGKDCMLPYPSDFFRQPDAAMPSGFRVVMADAAKLKTTKGASADITEWKAIDGFSKIPPIVALLGGPASAEGLTSVLDSPEATTKVDSPTLLIEADSGALVPHFVDLDSRAAEDPDHQALVIHPVVGLKAKTRYVVAFKGVKGQDGSLAPAPEGFRRLRDGDDDASLADLRARFDKDVFSVTDKAGAARSGLQLAWDFTTGSDELVSADMLSVREQVLAYIAQNPPVVKITKSTDSTDPGSKLWRTIEGTVTVPLYLDSTDIGAELHRGGDGKVAQNGTAEVPFLVKIPAKVRDSGSPGRALAYGHGFFGSRDEVGGDSTITIADTLGAVLIGIDWWGMSSPDKDTVITSLTKTPTQGALFTERVHQAMANWAVMTAAIKGSLSTQKEMQRDGDASKPLYDPSAVYFLGISQGHILGGTLAAFDPDLGRVALNVGGAGLAHMMFRALPFNTFLLLLSGPLPSALDQQKYAASLQAHLDRIDPGFWASRVLADKLPGSPDDRRVLQQAGIGDTQVPNLGSFLHARLLGLPQMSPGPRVVYGLEQVASPHDGSAFTLYDMGFSDDFYKDSKPAPKENAVHNTLRLRADVLDQMDQFFRPDSKVILSDKGK